MGWNLPVYAEGVYPAETRAHFGSITPGVQVVIGPNGAGKSSLLGAIDLFGQSSWKPGDVQWNRNWHGLSVRIEVGDSRLIFAKDSAPIAELGPDLVPISRIPAEYLTLYTGANRISPESALRARLEAICALGQLVPTPELISKLADGATLPKTKKAPTLIDVADLAAAWLHDQKRQKLSQAATVETGMERLKGVRGALLSGYQVTEEQAAEAGSPADAAALVRMASARHTEALEQAAWAEREAKRREELKASLAERPDVEAVEMGLTMAHLGTAAARSDLGEARLAVATAEAKLEACLKIESRAELDAVSVRNAVARWDETSRLINQPVPQPDPDAAVMAAQELAFAQQAERAAMAKEAVAGNTEELHEAELKRKLLTDQAELLEQSATSVWKRLGEIMSGKLASEWVRVTADAEGNPVVEVKRLGEWVDIALKKEHDVSEGQALQAVLAFMTENFQGRGRRAILIENNIAIDRARLRDLSVMAKEHDIAVVVEMHDPDRELAIVPVEEL